MSAITHLMDRLSDRGERLRHCKERVGSPPRYRMDRRVFNRGVMVSRKVLGVSFDDASFLLSKNSLHMRHADVFGRMPVDCPENAVGHVYTVECPDYPGVKKVGFSTDLDRRLDELQREYRVTLRFTDKFVGTYADEFALQRRMGKLWLVGEWFAAPTAPRLCPKFISAVKGRPTKETAENWLSQLGHGAVAVPNAGPFHSRSEAAGRVKTEAPADWMIVRPSRSTSPEA